MRFLDRIALSSVEGWTASRPSRGIVAVDSTRMKRRFRRVKGLSAVGKVDARAIPKSLIMKLTIPSAGGNGFSRLVLKSFERAFDRTDVVLVAQRLPY